MPKTTKIEFLETVRHALQEGNDLPLADYYSAMCEIESEVSSQREASASDLRRSGVDPDEIE
jgi:hypothetical protein